MNSMPFKTSKLIVCLTFLLAAGNLAAQTPDTRVADAMKSQDRAAAQALLKSSADVNGVQGDGTTALHWSAHWNDLDAADLLLRAGAKVNAETDNGVTPLYLASVIGSAAMVEKLLAAGANPNLKPSTAVSPLMMAARAGSEAAVKALLAAGADPNARENSQDQTALMWAVAQGHAGVVRMLAENGADLKARSRSTRMLVVRGDPAQVPRSTSVDTNDTGGNTPVMFAARTGNSEIAKILIDAGADVNDKAADGNSALVVAAHSGHRNLAAFLLEKGADPNADGAGYAALHAAVVRGDIELAKILLKHGARPNTAFTKATVFRRNSVDVYLHASLVGGTPVFLAAKYASPDMIRTLVTAGADLRLPANDGTTPLMAAVNGNRQGQPGDLAAVPEAECLEAVKVLIESGTDPNAANPAGDTAMHVAASKGFNSVIQLLASHGARLDARNQRGQTPLAVALSRPQLQTTADLLRKLGAID
jgi:ankyrin repeat protein